MTKASYYIPVGDYYGDVWFVGPFSSKVEAGDWYERSMLDPHIDRNGHCRHFDNLIISEPICKSKARKNASFRRGWVLSPNTEPTFAAITEQIQITQQCIDAVR